MTPSQSALIRYRIPVLLLVLSSSFPVLHSFAQGSGPGLEPLNVDISEFSAPSDVRLSPFLAYDSNRDAVWSGDISDNGSRLVELLLDSHKYMVHPLSGNAVPTHVMLDSKNTIWYLDSFGNVLGHYFPQNGTNKLYSVPATSELLGMAIDGSDNPWIITPNSNRVFEFDSASEKFQAVNLPSTSTMPFAITWDKTSGKIWIAEFMEKVLSIEPQSKKIVIYNPNNISLGYPVSVIADPSGNRIYFSEHNLYDVKALDIKTEELSGYSVDFGGYPTGLAFDKYGYLWVSEHTLDKVAVIDTTDGTIRQFDIPKGSLVQYLAEGSGNRIFFLDYGTNSVGVIDISSSGQGLQLGEVIPSIDRLLADVTKIFSGFSILQ